MSFLTKQDLRDIGKLLWEERNRRRWKIEYVARVLNLSPNEIDVIELGKSLSFKKYRLLANLYGKKMIISFEDKMFE